MSLPCQRLRARNAADGEDRGGHVDDARVEDVDRDGGDQADHAGGDAEQERADARVLGDRDQQAVEEDREDERGEEDADGHREPAAKSTREVADEGGEDDQRRGKHPADREAVDELALGEPVLAVDRGVVKDTGSPCRHRRR